MSDTPPIAHWLPIDKTLATGAQIDQPALDWLARNGYTLVVNLNTPGARNFWQDEADRARKAGLHYIHYPLDCSDLTPDKYRILHGILSAHRDGRTFLHCAMNVKSSGMAHIWRVKELGHDPVAAKADLASTPGHEPKWERFWEEMGA